MAQNPPCHPERSEGSRPQYLRRFFATLRMTVNRQGDFCGTAKKHIALLGTESALVVQNPFKPRLGSKDIPGTGPLRVLYQEPGQ